MRRHDRAETVVDQAPERFEIGNFSPDGRYLFAADLGTDHVYVYHFDPVKGIVTPATAGSPAQPPVAGRLTR